MNPPWDLTLSYTLSLRSFLFNLCFLSFSVPFKEAPKFNPRRRTSAAFANFSSPRLQPPPSAVSNSHQQPQYRLDSSPRGGAIHSSNSGSGGDRTAVPSSPSPSDRSLPPFSSGSSISETTSTGSGSSSINPQQLANGHHRGEKAKSLLQQSLQNSLVIHEDEHLDSASALAVSIGNGKKTFLALFTNFFPIRIDLVTMFDRKLQVFKNSSK